MNSEVDAGDVPVKISALLPGLSNVCIIVRSSILFLSLFSISSFPDITLSFHLLSLHFLMALAFRPQSIVQGSWRARSSQYLRLNDGSGSLDVTVRGAVIQSSARLRPGNIVVVCGLTTT